MYLRELFLKGGALKVLVYLLLQRAIEIQSVLKTEMLMNLLQNNCCNRLPFGDVELCTKGHGEVPQSRIYQSGPGTDRTPEAARGRAATHIYLNGNTLPNSKRHGTDRTDKYRTNTSPYSRIYRKRNKW